MSALLLLTGAGVATTPVVTDPPVTPWTGPTNVVVDGNSISANFYTSIGTLDKHLKLVEPLASRAGLTTSCFAVSGHTWQAMIDSHGTLVDGAWKGAGELNVLFAWETTNSVFNGATAAQVIAQVQTYINARLALHPWKILLGGSLPRLGVSTAAAQNAIMSEVDAHLAANWQAMGAAGFVNFRDHPAFNHDGTAAAPFEAYLDYWVEQTAGNFIHLTDTGKVPIRERVVAKIAALGA